MAIKAHKKAKNIYLKVNQYVKIHQHYFSDDEQIILNSTDFIFKRKCYISSGNLADTPQRIETLFLEAFVYLFSA